MSPRWSRSGKSGGVLRAAAEISRAAEAERQQSEPQQSEPAAQEQSTPAADAGAGAAPAGDTLRELATMAEALLQQATDLRRQTQALAKELEARESGGTTGQVSRMRIVAVNMAASGRTRAETADYLRKSYGEEPDAELLDQVFASETGQQSD